MAHVQFATDEADFDQKLGTAIALQQLHEYIEGDLTFFCMLAGIRSAHRDACQSKNADALDLRSLATNETQDVPPTWPDRIRIPVRALSDATRWWYEYGKVLLLPK